MKAINLDDVVLERGAHESPERGFCAMELAAYIGREPHSDSPECVSPILGSFIRSFNDILCDTDRQKLKPFVLLIVGTADDGADDRRFWLCIDWLIRIYTPTWLDLAKLDRSANALRALPEITNLEAIDSARVAIKTATHTALTAKAAAGNTARAAARAAAWAAAGNAARDAARDAARSAAGNAAGDAARAAAGNAAWAAVWDAAWDAAWNAAWDAAWDAAGSAAWAAAWNAESNAAGNAARKAVGDAAKEALHPTVLTLQSSAFDHLDRLIKAGKEPHVRA